MSKCWWEGAREREWVKMWEKGDHPRDQGGGRELCPEHWKKKGNTLPVGGDAFSMTEGQRGRVNEETGNFVGMALKSPHFSVCSHDTSEGGDGEIRGLWSVLR